MWLESVNLRLKRNNLDSIAESLEAAGIIKDFSMLIRRSKALISASYQSDFLSVIRILTEELWKETNTSLKSTSTLVNSKPSLNLSGIPSSPPTKRLNLGLNTSKISDSSFLTSPKYKLQVSQDVAYMSTFSFPKGCATFYKSKRVTTNKIPEGPGPGSYFCDPKTPLNRSGSFSSSLNSIKSCRRLSGSIIR